MNLVTIAVILLLVWLIYSILDSYNNLQSELREIRMKCISGGGNISETSASGSNPIKNMKQTLIGGLTSLLQKTS